MSHDESTRELLDKLLSRTGLVGDRGRGCQTGVERSATSAPTLPSSISSIRPVAFSIVKELKRRETWRDVPVIVLSAQDLTPAEREHLSGQVRQIIEMDENLPEELTAVLRRIAPVRAATPRSDPKPLKPRRAHA